jgi:hypothetical protein
MSNGWTPERRMRQAALIANWKPWSHSTGPRQRVHGPDVQVQQPCPIWESGRANIIRAPHLQHAVESVDSHVNFGRPTLVYT